MILNRDNVAAGGEVCNVKSDHRELAFYLRHRNALIDYATPIVGCRGRAEDVVQEAFLRYTARAAPRGGDAGAGPYPAIANPVAYLYRIVRNLALDWRRRPEASMETGDDGGLDQLPAPVATPEETAIHREQLRVLADALQELPERTRTAFRMRRLEGRSLQEIADHLGVSVVRAHQLVKDAIRHGARRLDADDGQ